ncbi:putative dammarenediol II synthase [Helianthus annuus]|nr:putative dammarenediol II synthase [Helianthus annuus]
MAEEYGDCLKKAHFYLKESQVKENPSGDFTKMCRQFTKGSWTFADQDHGWTVSDCTSEALRCLLLLSHMPKEIAGDKDEPARLYEAVERASLHAVEDLLFGSHQFQNHFYSFLTLQRFLQILLLRKSMWKPQHPIIGALVEFTRVHTRHRKEEIELSISNGVRYLEETQWHDGSWYGYWGVCFIYGTFFALRGLSSTGNTYENSVAVRKGVNNFLLSTQNDRRGLGRKSHILPY